MSHLTDVKLSYLQHLKRSWTIAGVLMVHGLFPNVWKNKASNMLCQDNMSSTKKYLLEHYGVKID